MTRRKEREEVYISPRPSLPRLRCDRERNNGEEIIFDHILGRLLGQGPGTFPLLFGRRT